MNLKEILFVALALVSLAGEKAFADDDQKYLGLSSEERAYLNPNSKAFKKHTNEMLLGRLRNYCSMKGEVLDESNLDSIIYSEYSGDDPLVDLSSDEKNMGNYPLWPRWFYTDGKKASYVNFTDFYHVGARSALVGGGIAAITCSIGVPIMFAVSAVAGVPIILGGTLAGFGGLITCDILTTALKKKTGQTAVRKLTYARALKKLEKDPIGASPSVVKMRIANTEKVPHLLFANPPCVNLAVNQPTKPEMTEVKWEWKLPLSRPASVRESIPPYEEVESVNPPRYSERVETTEGPSQQVSEDCIEENIVNQNERMGQLIQQLADLPAPPRGFSNEDDSESEEEIPVLVLE